jgi:hypothetical protein
MNDETIDYGWCCGLPVYALTSEVLPHPTQGLIIQTKNTTAMQFISHGIGMSSTSTFVMADNQPQ